MLGYYFKTSKDLDFTSLEAPKEGCWIHADETTSQDLNEICSLAGLEYTDIHDSLDKYEIPRLDKIKHHVIFFMREPIDLESGLYTATLTIIVTTHYLITICPQKSSIVQGILSHKTKISTLQRHKLLIHILFRLNQEFGAQIKKVRHNVFMQEKEMIHVDSEDITTLTKNEEILNQYLSALLPIRGVLESISSGKDASLYEKEHDLMEDLVNAVKQAEDLCTSNLRSIRSLRDSYQIIFTNNLHKTIKLLTSLTIIFSIPTMIASLYGMNVSLPLEQNSYAFPFILACIAGISAFGLFIFHRKKWL